MQSIYNNLIIRLGSKFNNEVKFASGVTLYTNPNVNSAEYVTLIGEVVSLPKAIGGYRMLGFSSDMIKPGDIVLIRYDVVFDYKSTPLDESIQYKHLLDHMGKEYWMCSIDKVFAIIGRDGSERMINGYIKLEHEVEVEVESTLIIPDYLKQKEVHGIGVVENIGENEHGIKIGDKIFYKPNVAQHYMLNDYQYAVIHERHVVGVLEEA